MIKSLLDFVCLFDWISPLLAWFLDRLNGPQHTFLIPESCGWSGRRIQRMLKSYGVKSWGLMFLRHNLLLSVSQAQAHYAQDLLQRHRIPTLSKVPARKRAPQKTAHQQPRPAAPVDDLTGWVEKLREGLRL